MKHTKSGTNNIIDTSFVILRVLSISSMETNKKNDNVYNNITNTKKSEGNNNIQPIIWSNVIAISLLHILFPISFFLTITKMKFLTIAWSTYEFLLIIKSK